MGGAVSAVRVIAGADVEWGKMQTVPFSSSGRLLPEPAKLVHTVRLLRFLFSFQNFIHEGMVWT